MCNAFSAPAMSSTIRQLQENMASNPAPAVGQRTYDAGTTAGAQAAAATIPGQPAPAPTGILSAFAQIPKQYAQRNAIGANPSTATNSNLNGRVIS